MNGLRYFQMYGVDLAASGALRARSGAAAAGKGHQREARPVRLPRLVGVPRTLICQRVANLDVIFAIDDSGSVHGPDGTDPRGTRNAACLSVIDLMQRYGGGRAGVVHWGNTAPASMALAPMPVHRGRLRRELRFQPVLGGTQPAVALARVCKLVQGTSSGRTLAVLLITDGQDLGTGLEQALGQLPARSVHLILVDPSGDCWGQDAAWRELPWGSFTRLENLSDPKRLAWESGAVIARSIGLRLPARTSSRTPAALASLGKHCSAT
jgi:von Willebrand factor type A domain